MGAALAGDERGSDTQRLASQTMGRPFVAEGGLGLERKTCGLMVLRDSPRLPSPQTAVEEQQQRKNHGYTSKIYDT